MARKISMFALLVTLTTLLAACDKCGGGLQEIQLPLRPNACKTTAAQ
jgi:hypothetical protein